MKSQKCVIYVEHSYVSDQDNLHQAGLTEFIEILCEDSDSIFEATALSSCPTFYQLPK